ncbi:aldehyde dehydrogenase family protein [Arthrobacter psychrochitiniphilus]|nr:aldehyde dehydrogenase family protein [Arthrobacter psychrochitiniphilus]NYG16669.1 acyl-CoA reductase-like NAD-dependent aldehyde dehydrogenase [Arthrobacter psychrochitiniphilus]
MNTAVMTWFRDDVLIGGSWQQAGATQEVENPATAEVIGSAALCDGATVDAAVAAARTAAGTWGAKTAGERADAIEALVAVLRQRREELVAVTVAEVGVSVSNARAWHVDLAIDLMAAAATNARNYAFEEESGTSVLLRKPVGVVACITPWNYPLYQLAAKVGPALAAGCTVVLKPALLAPLSSYIFAEATIEAGLPEGVFNLISGAGSAIGDALTGHPGVDFISFTGSTTVGREVGATAARNLKRACLELGGKSSSIICADADFAAAVTGTVDAAMLNSGQTCSAWTRMLVPAQRYEEALELAAAHVKTLVVGDPTAESTDLGPLVSAKQKADVLAVIDGALCRGARLVTGPPVSAHAVGHYVNPTILADLAPTDPASQQEIFGPVLVVHAYSSEAEAIEIANGTVYGLAGAVWAGSTERALELARHLDTGQVDLNGAPFNPQAPFGGWKDSGIGRELGVAGLEEYTEITAVQR